MSTVANPNPQIPPNPPAAERLVRLLEATLAAAEAVLDDDDCVFDAADLEALVWQLQLFSTLLGNDLLPIRETTRCALCGQAATAADGPAARPRPDEIIEIAMDP
jgi:hypothetical protein